MRHTNAHLAMLIIQQLEEIDSLDKAHVSAVRCRARVHRLCKGKPLSSLHERTLRHLFNMFHGILVR